MSHRPRNVTLARRDSGLRKTIRGYVQVARRKEFRRFWLGMLLSANWELAYIVGPAAAGVIVATIGAPFALVGVPTVILAIACAYAALGLLPLLALRNVDPAGADRRVQISSIAR
jgi:hypothetical protein